jgi:hypothetical protein
MEFGNRVTSPVVRTAILGFLGLAATGASTGCAVSPSSNAQVCTLEQFVSPATATASHMAVAPGNQVSFDVGHTYLQAACANDNVIASPQGYVWVSSDPVNAPISNAKDATAGTVTCLAATKAIISTSTVPTATVATLGCN